MTYPIRSVPDNDTAWGADFRATIAAANDHQTRLVALETAPTENVHTVGSSGTTLTVNPTVTGSYKVITLSAACTFTFAGATAGKVTRLDLELTQDGTGGRVATWPASVKWSGGAPTLSTTAGAVDQLTFWSRDGGTTWFGAVAGKGFA